MSSSVAKPAPEPQADAAPRPPRRKSPKRAYLILAVVALLAVGAYVGYGIYSGNQASTDDAQLEADVTPLAARVGGVVQKIAVQDNQSVKKGDLLAELDPTDYQIRVAQAEADLEGAYAQASTTKGGGDSAHVAQVEAARAALARADAELRKADSDLVRAKRLKAESAITAVELETAQNTAEKARAAQAQASAQLRGAEEQHGFATAKVKAAQAALDQAKTQLGYTHLVAPHDGTLSKLAIQEGQLVQAGQMIVQLVDPEAYVVANFKETQVGRMRPGQRAEIEVDAYPGRTFEGKVESLAAATGARFSLLPPDNASGNFVKVVQRVPVKIRLEGQTSPDTALKAGLSADVTVRFK